MPELSDHPHLLEIYVAPDCQGCETARRMARTIAALTLPQVEIRLIDLGQPGTPRHPDVFAVPTYVFDGRVISLGNPYEEWLIGHITKVVSEQSSREGSSK